jgi:hypothetical protein
MRQFATEEAVGYTAPERRIGLGPTVTPAAFMPVRCLQHLPGFFVRSAGPK